VTTSGVTAIVLAGGRSTRFGGDKLAALVAGRPLLHRAIHAVAEVADEVVVVLAPDAPAPNLPERLATPIVIARDVVAGSGPLAGLAAGLSTASHPRALLVAGDQPFLRVAVLRALLDELGGPGRPDAADVVALEDGDSLWPFPVGLRVETVRPEAERALAEAERAPAGADLRLFTLFGRLRVARVPEARWRALDPRGDSLRDVDTRNDIASLPSDARYPAADQPTARGAAVITPDIGPFAEPIQAAGAWAAWWRGWYRLLRLAGGLLDRLAQRPGFGNLVVLRVVGRRSGRERTLPLGLLTVGGHRYLGHPSGDAAWTLNLRAAASATIESARIQRTRVRPVLLGPGPERDAAVRASFRQHPFPGNALYRLAGSHVAATGVFFRLEPFDDAPPATPESPGTIDGGPA
jgi:molybdopterin-guanine dinucleotide biosynthesis protein A